jgi:hypothetical protein
MEEAAQVLAPSLEVAAHIRDKHKVQACADRLNLMTQTFNDPYRSSNSSSLSLEPSQKQAWIQVNDFS